MSTAVAPAGAYDVVIVGAGPAGLAAALGLVRQSWRVLLIDSNRPRHAATLQAHGFITRDGVAPLELRTVGRAEFMAYPGATFAQAEVWQAGLVRSEEPRQPRVAQAVVGLQQEMAAIRIAAGGVRGAADFSVAARVLIVATGLREVLPEISGLRAFYGTAMHSCLECDMYEKQGREMLVIGSDAAAVRAAKHAARLASSLLLATNGVDPEPAVVAAAAQHGFVIKSELVVALEGQQSALTTVCFADGSVFPVSCGFVSPCYENRFEWLDSELIEDSRVVFVGECATGVPQQLLVAAGAGAAVVAPVNDLLLGV